MGYNYEVYAWTNKGVGSWEDVKIYEGNSVIRAMLTALKLRLDGCGCVTIKLRG